MKINRFWSLKSLLKTNQYNIKTVGKKRIYSNELNSIIQSETVATISFHNKVMKVLSSG